MFTCLNMSKRKIDVDEKELWDIFPRPKDRRIFLNHVSIYNAYVNECNDEYDNKPKKRKLVEENEVESDEEYDEEYDEEEYKDLKTRKNKKPKKLTLYQKFMSKTLPQLKEEYPLIDQKERFCIAAKMWNEEKV